MRRPAKLRSCCFDSSPFAPWPHGQPHQKDTATLELFCWLEPGADLPGWDILKGSPFGATLATPEGGEPTPADQLLSVQNYFAEYHLEYFRQRRYNHFPSRLHALLQFATRTDAMIFRSKHPQRVSARTWSAPAPGAPTPAPSTTPAGSITCACRTACRSPPSTRWPITTGRARRSRNRPDLHE